MGEPSHDEHDRARGFVTVRRPVRWWVLQLPDPLRAAALAPGFEADGWDGIAYGDNQCRVGDVVITLTLAAQATQRVHLGTGVTNAVTRHPTILASAWANLQELSNGRMMLGLARGDSALADIGLAMQPVAKFETVVRQLRTLLAGDAVEFEQAKGADGVPGVESLNYAKSHAASRIEWMSSFDPTGSARSHGERTAHHRRRRAACRSSDVLGGRRPRTVAMGRGTRPLGSGRSRP